jgi:putative transport protein
LTLNPVTDTSSSISMRSSEPVLCKNDHIEEGVTDAGRENMEWLGALLNSQPFVALFLAIGLGFAVGNIRVAGFSLGVGAVLFVGLVIGVFAPKSAPPGIVGTLGLVLFLYGIGIQYGVDFFRGLATSSGIKANTLALVAVVAGGGAAILCAEYMGFGVDFALGIFAGSLTSTGALQAATAAIGSQSPAIGYACAYPFGVFGPILCFYLFKILIRPKVEVPEPRRLVTAELPASVRNLAGLSVAAVTPKIPQGVELVVLRRRGRNMLPRPEHVFAAEDVLVLAGYPEAIAELEGLSTGRDAIADRQHLDYVMVYVSKANMVGMRLADVPPPPGCSLEIVQVRRGDADIVPRPDLTLEYGDRLGLIINPESRTAVIKHFGDSVLAEASFSFVALGLGIALGALVGLIPIPIPGVGTVTLGLAGGPLVVALVLGWLGRTGPIIWHLPASANQVLRNVGLALFLARVGIDSGTPFVEQVSHSGFAFVFAGMIVLLTVVVIVLVAGYFLFKINFDELLGIAAGATGNPAILAYGNSLAPTGKPDINYAMVFPGVGTIVKIIAVQVLAVSYGIAVH